MANRTLRNNSQTHALDFPDVTPTVHAHSVVIAKKLIFALATQPGSRRRARQYHWYKDCLKNTLKQCDITPSQLEMLASDRTDWRSMCKYETSKHDESTSWKQSMIRENLGHHLPATFSVKSANRCVVHTLDSLPTANPTRDYETQLSPWTSGYHLTQIALQETNSPPS